MKLKFLSLAALAAAALLSTASAQTTPTPAPAPTLPPIPAATRPGKEPLPEHDKVVVDANTEKLLHGALKFLAGQQSPAGSWSSRGGEHPVAMTGYTLMAFLACGELPGEGEFGRNVANGVNYLLASVREDGYITSESVRSGRKSSNMYDHGVATIALAEVYGQTQDPNIKSKLELAVKLILTAQSRTGGWRYAPRPADADISVTVLQVVALRAAKNAGIIVPQSTIDNAIKFIKECYDEHSGGFCYTPHSGPGFARTAAGTYCLQVCGLYDDKMVKTGSEYLLKTRESQPFTYGAFYAAPAQYMIGGDTWTKWYAHMHGILVPKVVAQGDIAYWNAVEGDQQGQGLAPVYTTAIYTTILAMPYHYVPLYQR